jgi:hypothetical protein
LSAARRPQLRDSSKFVVMDSGLRQGARIPE